MPLLKKISPVILCALWLMAGCNTVPETPTPENPEENIAQRTIVLGDISDDPAEVIEGSQPLADYLASQLADYGITGGEVKVVRSTDEMIEMLAAGEIDLYFDSVYPATIVSDASGGEMVLRRWRYGVEEYQSVIFATKESGITSLNELHGHMLAFDNKFSTSGFVLPAVFLSNAGVNLVGKTDYNAPVGADEAGFVFSFDDENTLLWIQSGFVDAAATDDYYYDTVLTDEIRAGLIELTRTDYVPRQVVVVSPKMSTHMQEAVIEILVATDETEAGLAALKPFQTTQFDRFPEGIEVASDRMRKMVETINAIPLE
jgi:phosphonate transport system substrate-binding protein